jgi:AraC-like DNA-binding protein
MPTDMKVSNEESRNDTASYVSMYYEHQYDRIARHEQMRLTISNTALGISAIALTFGFSSSQGVNVVTGIGLPVVVIAVNIFAILYFRRSVDYTRAHRERAKRILELYAQDIYKVDQETQWSHGFGRFWSDRRVQVYTHVVLILAACLPVLVYLRVFP